MLLNKLKDEGLSVEKIFIDKAFPTSTVIAIVDNKGERTMLSYRAADPKLEFNETIEAVEEMDKSRVHMHFTGYGILFDPERTACMKVLEGFKGGGSTISFDASPMASKIDKSLMREVLKKIDILFANESEIRSIVGGNGMIEGIKKLARKYVPIVTVKMGKKGALIANKSEVFRIKPPKTPIVDKVGAGDVFDAGFIASWLKGFEIKLCGIYRVAAAVLKISKRGSWVAFPNFDQVEKFVRENKSWEPFRVNKFIIGMVHLPPLPSSPFYKGGAIDSIIEYALDEARKLEESEFDGVLIENFGDAPFTPVPKNPETIASMAVIVKEIVKDVKIPVGVNMLRNGGLQALAIAHASGAEFIRVNALVESLVTDQGIIEPIAHELLKMRTILRAEEVKILADVRSKHAAPLADRPIDVVAREASERGKADFLIVTGSETGKPPSIDLLKTVKNSSKTP
ncbi:MAG: BtpA/SgcQ family protein, partial [Candidatus Bathyarchaeia archaeon]